MITILDKFKIYWPAIQAGNADTILLGHLESAAYLESMKQVYGVTVTMDDLVTANHAYRGLTVMPVNTPSIFLVVKTIHKEEDESLRV